jgi:hypothetical protein
MPTQPPFHPDGDQLVDTVTAAILARHPEFTHDAARVEVAASYHRLARDTRIPDHLAVLVQHEATDRLRDATARPGDDPAAGG